MTSQAQAIPPTDTGTTQGTPEPCHAVLTAPPAISSSSGSTGAGQKGAPAAKTPKIIVSPDQPVDITARQCEAVGKTYTLRGDAKIKFADYVFQGDTVTYDSVSGNATASGHVALDGGPRDMHITASHGAYNVRGQTGKFYDVKGTTGARFRGLNVTLTSSNPIAFAARIMEQTAPEEYVLYHGSVTSCELPHPKWRFHAAKIILHVGDTAKLHQSTFRLKGVPILYLPYASTPAEKLGRQSGFLVPTFGTSNTKGTIVGDSYYWAINRSMDATLGGEYLSKIGWMLLGDYRSKPTQTSFLNLNYFQVLTHQTVAVTTSVNGVPTSMPVNEGGEDIKLNSAAVFPHDVRGVASLEYLSSFVFREQFSPTFTQAVNSEVSSTAFLSKSVQGYSFNGYLERYQNFQSTAPGNVITILHTPAIETDGVDQRIAGSPVYWSYDFASEGLKRSEPGFVTPNLVGRFDVDPVVSLPLYVHGWTLRPSVDLRETLYTQQNVPGPLGPVPTDNSLNRRTIGASLDVRLPTLEKVFAQPLAGRKIKHTVEPYAVYRYTNGVENFASIIRFDFRDILSNTNEVEYGLIQRLYLKRLRSGCDTDGKDEKARTAAATSSASAWKTASCTPSGADEFVTWEVKQKYFLDPNFGGAVVNGTRNVFTTTDALTGIAFVTSPRRFSPIVSRLNFRTSGGSDLGWALDYDTTKGRINSSTLYATYHFGNYFLGGSEAYMQDVGEIVFAPGTTTQLPPCLPGGLNSVPCVPQVYNQVRALVGYGSPSKRGWSAAGNIGYDFEFQTLQYGAAQGAYNWDCCGIAVEYRRFSLGSIRNENQYRFAFTLANIGSFGNMKRQERLF
ncbi:MAG TPA: LPS assembly protein LptD [Candidatus Angelobacter sp.]